MTASELRYLIAAHELSDGGRGAKASAMADKLGVSKASVCKAVEKLSASGYIGRAGKRVILTDKGSGLIVDYLPVIKFIGDKLVRHCNTPEEVAFSEAVVAASALGEVSRNAVLSFVKGSDVG